VRGELRGKARGGVALPAVEGAAESCGVDEPERRKRAGGREWRRGRERALEVAAGGRGGWG
jgi:hypothetical protein